MKALSVLGKVLCAKHELTHALQCSLGLLRNLVPRSFEASDGSSTQCRNDGCNSGEIVQLPAFLEILLAEAEVTLGK